MGIKVNMTEQEASSAPRENLPAGNYLVAVTDGSLAQSKSTKNAGKPYYSLTLTVQDGKYAGRNIYTNVMCFDGALYSIVQMLKALDVPFQGQTFHVPDHEEMEIPELDWFLGKEFVVQVKITPARKDPATGKEYDARNDVKGWMAAKDWAGAPAEEKKVAASTKNSLLP